MTVEIRLTGDAAKQAQHLVADLVSRGIPVESVDRTDSDRDLQELASDFGVALAVEATLALVREVVRAWMDRSTLSDDVVDVAGSDPDHESDPYPTTDPDDDRDA